MAYDTSPDAFDEYLQIAEHLHAKFGVPGANNDLNVLYGSPIIFEAEIADIDEGFEVNLRDVFVNPAPNICIRDWVESVTYIYRNTKGTYAIGKHTQELRQDLMEHLWNNDDE
ncbi:hypothetical protein Tco_1256009 [Tanacetum coccineum]